MTDTERKAGMGSTPLEASVTGYSSVVGQSIGLSRKGDPRVLALLIVSVPNPAFDYKATATAVASEVVTAINAHSDLKAALAECALRFADIAATAPNSKCAEIARNGIAALSKLTGGGE